MADELITGSSTHVRGSHISVRDAEQVPQCWSIFQLLYCLTVVLCEDTVSFQESLSGSFITPTYFALLIHIDQKGMLMVNM